MLVQVWVVCFDSAQLTAQGWWLVGLYVLGGSGRAVFESTNKVINTKYKVPCTEPCLLGRRPIMFRLHPS